MRFRNIALAFLMLALAMPAVAQEQRASIEGVVKDATGAVMPGVTVEAKNENVGTPVTGLNRVKSRIRCCSGLTPVIMVVQMTGEIRGSNERRTPERPSRTSRARLGIVPSAQ